MQQLSVEVYDTSSNHVVLKTPGRTFPGCVVQGDSLSVLCDLSARISRRLQQLGLTDENLLDDAQELQTLLLQRLLHYQAVLDANGLGLPYVVRAGSDDLVVLRDEPVEADDMPPASG